MRDSKLALTRSCTVISDREFEKDGDQTLTEAFVNAIAEAEGVAPTELPPLYESVDFDALTQLMEPPDEAIDGNVIMALRIGKWNVFVSANGRIRVCDATIETDPESIFEDEPV
ncbi:hypothetical protein Har1130_19045 [Haloarcula sp. CBA1130]|uniref:HalOD1 output domain-containing protein n=1 Tax=unclassified Haloarcula TaxID=2624677 RepID=UPI001248D562|nr:MULTISPECIES: HalOD1 output domain-containing protein [unclassified Haloarcula]KAA9396238.1 hypothetical protein Har1129_17820 [Haloarcula sp. CBA1129]KAA9396378.1 hypothetical protein Har1130_19045 [Haloarcula sp. CBA1130]KAA9397450.1 hypothetical protein Har1129_03970 [Haloarcula sp. CBA1129]